jgi:hypothetical protein
MAFDIEVWKASTSSVVMLVASVTADETLAEFHFKVVAIATEFIQ